MTPSQKHSQLILRIGLLVVFLWLGVEKFIEPQRWIDVWVPAWAASAVGALGATSRDFVYLVGIFEVLVAVSLATGFFLRAFSVIAAVFLATVLASHGLNDVIIRDVAIIAALVSLVVWPERDYV